MKYKPQKVKIHGIKFHVLLMTTVLSFGFSFTPAKAQNSVNATGGNASGSGGSASYSVGQVVYSSTSETNASVAQGVQQSYEISVITAFEEAKEMNLSVSVFPNPAADYLILEAKDSELLNLHFQLYDLNGKLLQNEKITSNQTNIEMSHLAPATYFVKVSDINKELKTFKIIKN